MLKKHLSQEPQFKELNKKKNLKNQIWVLVHPLKTYKFEKFDLSLI